MVKRELTCISCPMGCQMTVCMEGGDIRRVVTSSVKVKVGELARVSVKTETDIPKDKIFDCMADILKAEVEAPVKIGNVIIENCAGTGIAVIATRNVEKQI